MAKEKQERPVVHVSACTANTITVKIITEGGTVFINAGHTAIIVDSDGSGLEIEVRP